jgi:hypothetical protein
MSRRTVSLVMSTSPPPHPLWPPLGENDLIIIITITITIVTIMIIVITGHPQRHLESKRTVASAPTGSSAPGPMMTWLAFQLYPFLVSRCTLLLLFPLLPLSVDACTTQPHPHSDPHSDPLIKTLHPRTMDSGVVLQKTL